MVCPFQFSRQVWLSEIHFSTRNQKCELYFHVSYRIKTKQILWMGKKSEPPISFPHCSHLCHLSTQRNTACVQSLLGKHWHLRWVHIIWTCGDTKEGWKNTRKGRSENMQTRKSHTHARKSGAVFFLEHSEQKKAEIGLLGSMNPNDRGLLLGIIWLAVGTN